MFSDQGFCSMKCPIHFARVRVHIDFDLCIDKHQCKRLHNQKHPSVVPLSLQNQHIRF